MSDAAGTGTASNPWHLKTPPLTSDFTMHRDTRDGREVLVCTVGKTVLFYDARCLADLLAILKTHGDWIELTRRGTAIIYGRSDSTINRHGIRMGTSELYRVVEDFPEVLDSLVIDLEYLGRESFMALFVVLRDGATEVPAGLRQALLEAIRTRLSARHVPNEVYAVLEMPRTMSGKKLEVPIKRILLGHPVDKSVNRDSMANPGAIDWFVAFAQRRTAAG